MKGTLVTLLLCATAAEGATRPCARAAAGAVQPLRAHTRRRLSTSGVRMSDELTTTSQFYSEIRSRGLATIVAKENSAATSPYLELISLIALGDAAALFLAAMANSWDGNLPVRAASFILLWAAAAPPLGAFAETRTLNEVLRAPVAPLGVAVLGGCAISGVLAGQAPAPQLWLVAFVEACVLVEVWRLVFFAVGKANSAIDAVVMAVVDEDGGGDDDF